MITILHRGEGGGSLGTPKSDYVICVRPLTSIGMAIIMSNSGKMRMGMSVNKR